MSRKFLYITLLIVLIFSLVGCAPKAANTTTTGKIKVGLSFSDYATERWPVEAAQMTQLLQKKGYEVITQEADHDVKLQSDQIDNMVSPGRQGLDRHRRRRRCCCHPGGQGCCGGRKGNRL